MTLGWLLTFMGWIPLSEEGFPLSCCSLMYCQLLKRLLKVKRPIGAALNIWLEVLQKKGHIQQNHGNPTEGAIWANLLHLLWGRSCTREMLVLQSPLPTQLFRYCSPPCYILNFCWGSPKHFMHPPPITIYNFCKCLCNALFGRKSVGAPYFDTLGPEVTLWCVTQQQKMRLLMPDRR